MSRRSAATPGTAKAQVLGRRGAPLPEHHGIGREVEQRRLEPVAQRGEARHEAAGRRRPEGRDGGRRSRCRSASRAPGRRRAARPAQATRPAPSPRRRPRRRGRRACGRTAAGRRRRARRRSHPPRGLHGVADQRAACGADERRDGGDGLQHAGLVVGGLHGDQRPAARRQGRAERVEVERAVAPHRQHRHGLGREAWPRSTAACSVAETSSRSKPGRPSHGEVGREREVRGLGRPGGEDHGPGLGPHERRHPARAPLRRARGRGGPRRGPRTGSRRLQGGQGGGAGLGAQRGRGVVVEVDARAGGLAGHGWITQKSCNRKGQAC